MGSVLEPGATVDHYRIVSLLGRGGMGEVYLAEDTALGRKVALKFLPTGASVDRDRLRRFAQEARTASSLNHPNILTIHEIGGEDAVPYIATEFVDGRTLRQRLHAGRPELRETLDLAIQVADALAAAHHAGVVHRDIKPENIMVRNDGYVKIVDFGLAKLRESEAPAQDTQAPTLTAANTQVGLIRGTPHYMSPEQARGLKLDERTDIFSLGAVLYEMVAGEAPFSRGTTTDVLAAIVQTEPPPLTCPVELQRIVVKALAKNRDERYQTAKDLLIDLKRLKSEVVGPVRRPAPVQWRRNIVALLALLVVAVGAIWFFTGRTSGITSLAVLPFLNASGDSSLEYLSDGISESLINSVSQLPNLKIMARSSVFRYKGRDVDPKSLARELGVQAVLTGRVLQRGEALSISVELVDARDNSHIWGEHYDRRLADILAVQNEIVKDISERLRLKLSGEEKKRLVKRYTENSEAYQLYLQGRYQQNKRTDDGLRKSVEKFQQAIAKDAGFALAYAGLADSYTYLANHAFMPPSQASPRAKSAILKALELDDTLAEAHTALAFIRMDYDWDWAGATKSFQRAIELNPAYTRAHSLYACVFSAQRRPAEALAEMNRALSLDSLSIYDNVNLGWHLFMARRYDEALAQLRKALEMEPNESTAHEWSGLVYEQKGMLEQAIAEFQKALAISGDFTSATAALGHAYALANRRAEARNLLDELRRSAGQRYVSSYDVAILLTGLGQNEQAMASLQRAFEEHDGWLPVWGNVDPRLDPLRPDPRFADLMRRIGLPP